MWMIQRPYHSHLIASMIFQFKSKLILFFIIISLATRMRSESIQQESKRERRTVSKESGHKSESKSFRDPGGVVDETTKQIIRLAGERFGFETIRMVFSKWGEKSFPKLKSRVKYDFEKSLSNLLDEAFKEQEKVDKQKEADKIEMTESSESPTKQKKHYFDICRRFFPLKDISLRGNLDAWCEDPLDYESTHKQILENVKNCQKKGDYWFCEDSENQPRQKQQALFVFEFKKEAFGDEKEKEKVKRLKQVLNNLLSGERLEEEKEKKHIQEILNQTSFMINVIQMLKNIIAAKILHENKDSQKRKMNFEVSRITQKPEKVEEAKPQIKTVLYYIINNETTEKEFRECWDKVKQIVNFWLKKLNACIHVIHLVPPVDGPLGKKIQKLETTIEDQNRQIQAQKVELQAQRSELEKQRSELEQKLSAQRRELLQAQAQRREFEKKMLEIMEKFELRKT